MNLQKAKDLAARIPAIYEKTGLPFSDFLFWKTFGIVWAGLMTMFMFVSPFGALLWASTSAAGVTVGSFIFNWILMQLILSMFAGIIITMMDSKQDGANRYRSHYCSLRRYVKQSTPDDPHREHNEQMLRDHEAYMQECIALGKEMLEKGSPVVQAKFLWAQARKLLARCRRSLAK